MYLIKSIVVDFVLAWRLLTVIPLPFIPEDGRRPAGKAAAYYPLVGLLLGLFLAGTGELFFLLLPGDVAAALVLVVWIGLTGMLHLDGFMDSCDGLLPPRAATRRLEIMKDSRVGAFAVVGVVVLLLLKFSALTALPSHSRYLALIIVPTLGRWAMTWVMGRYPLARGEGLSVFFTTGIGWKEIAVASIIAIGVGVIAFGGSGILLFLITWLIAILLARFAVGQIGGLTGDVYGAVCEVVEVILLVIIIGLGG